MQCGGGRVTPQTQFDVADSVNVASILKEQSFSVKHPPEERLAESSDSAKVT